MFTLFMTLLLYIVLYLRMRILIDSYRYIQNESSKIWRCKNMLQVCDGADGCDCVSEVRCEEGREEFGHRDAIASINRQHRELTIT